MFSFFLDLKLPLRCIYKKNREARDMYVNVENVNFAYDKKPILHDINFGMNKGEITGANYVQTECQFRYCGTAIPFLTVRSTVR